jgi:cell division ATPase FtsA
MPNGSPQLEAAAVADAEHKLHGSEEDSQRMLLVGYTATRYQLDGYPLANLLDHTGTTLAADVVATFLPGGVIDSLYAVMRQAGLDVQSLTLEPIAALNAAIPAQLRLLNLCLVDIGAGRPTLPSAGTAASGATPWPPWRGTRSPRL